MWRFELPAHADVLYVTVSASVIVGLLCCGWCAAWHCILKRHVLLKKIFSEIFPPSGKAHMLAEARVKRQLRRRMRRQQLHGRR